jgi:hypothetical protein
MLTTIIQEQPHGATASAGPFRHQKSIGQALAEPIEKQPSTVPMMMMPTQFDEINLKQVIISQLPLTYYCKIIINLSIYVGSRHSRQ